MLSLLYFFMFNCNKNCSSFCVPCTLTPLQIISREAAWFYNKSSILEWLCNPLVHSAWHAACAQFCQVSHALFTRELQGRMSVVFWTLSLTKSMAYRERKLRHSRWWNPSKHDIISKPDEVCLCLQYMLLWHLISNLS